MGRNTAAFLAAFILITAAGSFSLILRHPPAVKAVRVDLDSIPLVEQGWVAREVPMHEEIVRMLDVNKYLYREYVDQSGLSIWLFVGYFTSQKFGSGIHSPRNCLPGSGWEIVNRTNAPLPGDPSITVNRLDIIRGESRQVMYYWFLTRDGQLNNEFSLKGSLVKNALLGRPTDAAFIRITVPSTGLDSEPAEKRVESFIRIFKKEVYSALPF